jgi:hypothetical protein
MSEQDTMRLIAEVVDKYSGPMKNMQKSLRSLSDYARGVNQQGKKQVNEHEQAYRGLGKSIDETQRALKTTFGPALSAVGITALSVGGAIGGVVAAIKGLGDTSLTLTHLSKQSKLTVEQLRTFEEMGPRLGVSAEDMATGIAKFSQFMDQNARGAPAALNVWRQMPGSFEAIGSSLRGLGRDAQLKRVFDFIGNAGTPVDQKRKLLAMMGLPEDLALASRDELQRAYRGALEWSKAHPLNIAAGLANKEAFEGLRASLQGLKEILAGDFAPGLTKMLGDLTAFMEDKQNREEFKGWLADLGEEVRKAVGPFVDVLRTLHQIKHEGLGSVLKWDPKSVEDFKKFWHIDAAKQFLTGEFDPGGIKALNRRMHNSSFGPNWRAPGPGAISLEGFEKQYGKLSKDDVKDGTREGATKGVFDGLMQWWNFMRTSATGQGAGGAASIIKANYSPSRDGGFGGSRGGSHGGDGMVPPTDTTGLKGSAFLAAQRSGVAAEIDKDPGLKKQLAGMMQLEGSPLQTMESLANRTVMMNQWRKQRGLPPLSVRQMLHSGFYGPLNRGQLGGAIASLEHHPKKLQQMFDTIDSVVKKGSNSILGATDQGMPSDPNGMWAGGGFRLKKGGNVFNDWGGGPGHEYARRWRELQQKHVHDTMEAAKPSLHGQALRDHFGHRGRRDSLLPHAQRAGLFSSPEALKGAASLSIDLNGFPRGTKTAAEYSGMFKSVQLNRGRAMAVASEEA